VTVEKQSVRETHCCSCCTCHWDHEQEIPDQLATLEIPSIKCKLNQHQENRKSLKKKPRK
jgi:hypothetical protein